MKLYSKSQLIVITSVCVALAIVATSVITTSVVKHKKNSSSENLSSEDSLTDHSLAQELYGLLDMRIHQFIVQDEGHHLAEVLMNLTDEGR